MKEWKSQSGATLVEILVSLAIMIIVITVSAQLLISVNRMFLSSAKTIENKMVVEKVYKFVTDTVRFAVDLELSYDEKPIIADYNMVMIFTDDGRVFLNGKDVYGDLFYGGRMFRWRIDTNISKISVNLELCKEENVLYTTKGFVELVNLELENKQIVSGSESRFTNNEQNIYLYFQLEEVPELEEYQG